MSLPKLQKTLAAEASRAFAMARALQSRATREESAADIDNSLAANDLGGVASVIATLSNTPIDFVDRAIGQRSDETFLVLARAADLSVLALRRILQLRGKGHAAINDIEKSHGGLSAA